MSISFNHPKDTMTSTSTLELIVLGGTASSPKPIRLSSSSVIMPVRALPVGEMGAMVFDTATKSMKYHNGTSWVEMLSASEILEPIYTDLTLINNKLNTKIDSVTYTSSTVPSASVSGTQLNIVFPVSSSSGSGPTGLYTSLKPGCITQYSLTSGQTAASIREQMAGISGGQNGRNGTQGAPYVTSDGWCLSDGMWWSWTGTNGTVLKQVPNLCQQAYLRGIDINGATQTSVVIGGSATVQSTALSVAQIPPLQFTVTGQTSANGNHTHTQKTLGSDRPGANALTSSNAQWAGYTIDNIQPAGDHIHQFSGITNILGSGQGHSHNVTGVDVDHFNVAFLYNIAESNVALSEAVANSRYVLKTGDIMTGSLGIAQTASIRSNDNIVSLYLTNTSGGERAAVYHNTSLNALCLRSSGGSEVTIKPSGALTAPSITTNSIVVNTQNAVVSGKNVVRTVNGNSADGNGNVTISLTAVQGIRLGAARAFQERQGNERMAGGVMTTWADYGQLNYWVWLRPLQYLINGSWITVEYTNL